MTNLIKRLNPRSDYETVWRWCCASLRRLQLVRNYVNYTDKADSIALLVKKRPNRYQGDKMGNLSFINGCNAEGIEDNFGSINGGKYHQEIIISEFILNKLGKGKHPEIIKKEKIKPGAKSLLPTEYFSVQEKRPFIFHIFSPKRQRAFSNAAETST